MGYRVEYEPMEKRKVEEKKSRRVPALTAAFLLFFFLLVHAFWPRGREVLGEILWPGDAAVTAAALEQFAQELRMGQPLGDAVEGFCREIIADAGLSQN